MDLVSVHTQSGKDVIEDSLGVDNIIMTRGPVTRVHQIAAVSSHVTGVVLVSVVCHTGVTGEAKWSIGGGHIPTARTAITHTIHGHIDEPWMEDNLVNVPTYSCLPVSSASAT